MQLGAPRVGPGHWDPSHGLSCSREPRPKDALPFHFACRALAGVLFHQLHELLTGIDAQGRLLLYVSRL